MIHKLSCAQAIALFQKHYKAIRPDEDSIALTRDLWQEWEKSGETPPDITDIAREHARHENGFFYELIQVAERMEQTSLQIHFCQFSLEDYNAHALSVRDGYIILIDDVFFQLLYILSNIMVFDAMGAIGDHEKEATRLFVQEIMDNNYFSKKRYDFSQDNIHNTLLKRNYELAELGNYLFHSFKVFIIAHETGHHVLQHTTGFTAKKFAAGANMVTVETDDRKLSSEFEADSYGYRLFTALCDTTDDTVFYAYCEYKLLFAPLLLLHLFDHFGRMREERMQQAILYNTHPHPLERIKALCNQYPIDSDDPLFNAIKTSMDYYLG